MKKRADGRYKKNVYIGTDADGKKRYKSIYGSTLKELNEQEYRLRLELHKSYDLLADDTFATWADAFLIHQQARLTPAEHATMVTRTAYLKDRLGSRSVKEIRPMDVQRVIADLTAYNPTTGKPSAKRTVLRYRQLLSRIFRYAIDNRVCDYDPTASVDIPKTAAVSQRRVLTKEEQRRIREFDHPARLPMMLMLYSGLRRAEAAVLTWDDIDLDQHTISVTKAYDYRNGAVKPPKNGKARIVTIPQVLVDYLREQPHTGDLIITSRHGKMMTESAWQKMLESYLNAQNLHYGYHDQISAHDPHGAPPLLIQPFTYHCLRHTFCTMMYEAGVDVLVAQQQMGHSDVKTTLSIYTHLSREHQQNDIKKLDEMLSGGS